MRKIPILKDCAAPDCSNVAHTKGLCLNHYQRMKREEKKLARPAIHQESAE